MSFLMSFFCIIFQKVNLVNLLYLIIILSTQVLQHGALDEIIRTLEHNVKNKWEKTVFFRKKRVQVLRNIYLA